MRLRSSSRPTAMPSAPQMRLLPIGLLWRSTRRMSDTLFPPPKKERSILREIISGLAPTSMRAGSASWDNSRNRCFQASWLTSTRCAPIRTWPRPSRATSDHSNNIINQADLLTHSILQNYPTCYPTNGQRNTNKLEAGRQIQKLHPSLPLLNLFIIQYTMGQGQHHDSHSHSEHKSHDSHSHHSADPFTQHERTLIEMAHRNQKFQAHHHHHAHHQHVEYRRPFNINTDLGCFALKKLNAMNPEILRESDKRLLNPSGPGVITHLGHGLIITALPFYAFSVWKNFGFKAFLRPVVALPIGVLVGSSVVFQNVANYCREMTFQLPRSRMVSHYKDIYGEKFLIDVLDPTFRLPESLENK